MEHDESRTVYLEETAGGEARVEVGKTLGLSRQAYDGLWFRGEATVKVCLNTPQTEEMIATALNIAEEIVDVALAEHLQAVSDVMESHTYEAIEALEVAE